MNTKAYKIIIGTLVGLLFLYSLYYVLKKTNRQNNGNAGTGQKVLVAGTNEKKVAINDITKNNLGNISGTLVLDRNDLYNITYFGGDQSFTVVLLAQPLQAARTQAEQSLLKHLGVSNEEACNLKVMVTVPFEVSPQYSGQNLGLSLCPNAVDLRP